MNRYQPSTPRIALGFVAVVAAAINLGALVVLPAEVAEADAQIAAAVQGDLPHTDSSRATLAATDARARRHDLIARLVANVQDAGLMRLAAPVTTRSDR